MASFLESLYARHMPAKIKNLFLSEIEDLWNYQLSCALRKHYRNFYVVNEVAVVLRRRMSMNE